MDRAGINEYICSRYGTEPEFLWEKYPSFAVYRHRNNKKWFTVVMDIPATKLGILDDKKISVMNLKIEPILISSLVRDKGIFPAYHMNKQYWISVLLDGSVDDAKLLWLVDMSYENTAAIINKNPEAEKCQRKTKKTQKAR